MTDKRPPCDSEIVGRDGKPMPYHCNLPAGHLGGHASVYQYASACDMLRSTQQVIDGWDYSTGQPTPPASEPPCDSADSGKVR